MNPVFELAIVDVRSRAHRMLPIGEGIELSSLSLATVLSLVAAVVVFRTV